MKALMMFLALAALAVRSESQVCQALKCHTCVAGNEDECNHQGSSMCPQTADACTVVKSCTYRAFCDKAHNGHTGVKMECCFTDDCNGPHKGHSHGGEHSAAGALGFSPALVLGTLLVRLMLS
uniref:Si:ch211-113d22.2 n=1 Tax=Scleropages formosus TaxID=113540 RepID=A0A8C9SF50_SCLFO